MDTDFLVTIFLITMIFQLIVGKKIHGFILNPITFLNVIFFLHNWSFSFAQMFVPDLLWGAPGDVSYETQGSVLLINLISLWCLFCGYLLFFNRRSLRFTCQKFYNFESYKYIYIVLSLVQILMTFMSGSLSESYGEGQAATASEAFNPINLILTSRVIFGSIYLINSKKKDYWYIILFELLLSVVTGGRKAIVVIIISFALSKMEKMRVSPTRLLKVLGIIGFSFYFIGFISIFRLSTGSDISMMEKIRSSHNGLTDNVAYFLTVPLASVNSEGVQNWVYQLVESGEMKATYGLSYLQAVVNTVILRPFQGDLVNYQGAYYFKSIAYPDMNDHGWDFAYSAEAIQNFHNFAPIVSLILGSVLALIYNRVNKSNYHRSFYFFFIALLYIHFRTDSTALIRLIFFYFLFFILFRRLGLITLKSLYIKTKGKMGNPVQ